MSGPSPHEAFQNVLPTHNHEAQPPDVPDHRLLRLIGQGSYGRVWLARNATGAFRAIKVVHRQTSDGGRAFSRAFKGLRHYEPLSRLDDCLMDVLHVGPSEPVEYFYCVLELADPAPPLLESSPSTARRQPSNGSPRPPPWQVEHPAAVDPDTYRPLTLRSVLDQHHRLSVVESADLGIALCQALAALHRHGLVHRDVKPSNIIFAQGRAKLADIDLVTPPEATVPRMIAEGFTPPEGAGTPCSDLYSVGKVLYEASTGRDRTEFPTPPVDLDPEEAANWSDFNEILLRACAPIPNERYPDAQSMLEDLRLLRAGKSVRWLRTLERRQRLLTRLGTVAVLAGLVLAGALLREQFHARQLAALATENRNHAVRLHLAEAFRRIDDGDIPGSLPSLIAAWRRDSDDPKRAAIHQTRFAIVAQQCPQTVALGAHDGIVTSGRFSSDGRWIVTASDDHTARVWSTADGRPRYPPLQHPDVLLGAEFSHDDSRILTVSRDGTLSEWDALSGAVIQSSHPSAGSLQCAAFSPDRNRVALGGEDGRVSVHSLSDSRTSTGPDFSGSVLALAWSPDAQWLASGSLDGTTWVLNPSTWKMLREPFQNSAAVRSLAFHPDSRHLAIGSHDTTARVWNIHSGEPTTPPLRHSGTVWSLEFSPDGRWLLSGGGRFRETGEAQLWDVNTGAPFLDPIRHRMPVNQARFSRDGRFIATASVDHTCRMLEIASTRRAAALVPHTDSVRSLGFSPDGRFLLSTSRDGTWRLSTTQSPVESQILLSLSGSPQYMEVSRSGGWVATATTHGETLIADDKSLLPILRGPLDGSYRRVVSSADGSTVVFSCFNSSLTYQRVPGPDRFQAAGTLTNWSILGLSADGRLAAAKGYLDTTKPYEWVALFTASPDSGTPATAVPSSTGKDVPLQRWQLEHAVPLCRDTHLQAKDFVFSPDGRWIAGTFGPYDDGSLPMPSSSELRLWSTQTGQMQGSPIQQSGAILQFVFSPDSQRVLIATSAPNSAPRSAQLLHVESGMLLGSGFPHPAGVMAVAYRSDGHQLATGGNDGVVRLWDPDTYQTMGRAMQHARGILHLEYSRDNRFLLTTSLDRTTRLWDSSTGNPVSAPIVHTEHLWRVQFTEDNQSLIAATGQLNDASTGTGYLKLYHLPRILPSSEQAELISSLISGHRVKENGVTEPIPTPEWVAAFRESTSTR